MIQTARTTFLDRQNEAAPDCFTRIELSFYTQAQCFYNDGVRISSKKMWNSGEFGRAYEVAHEGKNLNITWLKRDDNFRVIFLTQLIERLDAYFPCIETDNYDVLAPLNLPTEGNVLDYGLSKMQNMANMFGLSVQSILRDWPILLAAVTNSPEFIEYRNGDPVIFGEKCWLMVHCRGILILNVWFKISCISARRISVRGGNIFTAFRRNFFEFYIKYLLKWQFFQTKIKKISIFLKGFCIF